MVVGDQHYCQGALLPGKGAGTHFARGRVGSRAVLDRHTKNSPSRGFDSRTIQPVASRYTN